MTALPQKRANPSTLPGGGKPAAPVLWWAAIGVVVTLIAIAVFGQWILSPDFKPAPVGTDVPPPGMQMTAYILQAIFTSGGLLFVWRIIVRPWVKEGEISWDGMFMLACFSMWLQDPMDNYFNFTFTYNGLYFNRSSWAMFIPGWEAPNQQNFAEPFFLMGAFFLWVFFACTVFGCWALRKLKTWLPQMSVLGHMAIMFAVFFLADLVGESLACQAGIFAYVAVYSPLALWAGTPHQFPLYESFGIATVCLGATVVRYSRNDQGQSFVEKGLQRLQLPKAGKKLLTFFALVAAIHVITFFGFFVPYTWFAMKADVTAEFPSYRLLEICGKGTAYACPSSEVPIPKRGSLAIPPDDARLSPQATRN